MDFDPAHIHQLIKAIDTMSVNTAALTSGVAALTTATAALATAIEANNDTAAQSAVDAATSQIGTITAQLGTLTTGLTGGGSGSGSITVTPTTFTGMAGGSFTEALSFSGGVAPYTVTDPVVPAGLTMDGSGNISGTYATGSGSGTVTDSTTPTPLTDNFTLTFG